MQKPSKSMMVRYMPLSNSTRTSSSTDNNSLHYEGEARVPPPALLGRCPKLSRYKILGCLAVAILSVILLVGHVTHLGYLTGGSNHMLEGKDGEGRTASPMCKLRVHQEDDAGMADASSGRNHVADADEEDVHRKHEDDFVIDEAFSDHDNMVKYEAYNLDDNPGKILQRRFPQAIVIGARKAGTRAVLKFLAMHPGIVICKEEPHFFDKEYDRGLEWYRSVMPLSQSSQVTIEKTPNYFVDHGTPELVHHFNKSIKLILLVRNPIDRAMSDYLQLRVAYNRLKAETEEKSLRIEPMKDYPEFEDFVMNSATGNINESYPPIKRSVYIRHLRRWLNYFGMSQILVLDGDNMKHKPWEEIAKIEDFLGLDHQIKQDCFVFNETKGFFCIKMIDKSTGLPASKHKCLSEQKGRPHPPIDPKVKQRLQNFFEPYNKKFFISVGRTFQWD